MYIQPKVLGLGGIFFTSPNKTQLYGWYKEVLGIASEDWGTQFSLKGNTFSNAYHVWSIFDEKTKYLEPSTKGFMINFVVNDIQAFEQKFKDKNIEILGKEESDFGIFMWICDPDGNKIELWQPPS